MTERLSQLLHDEAGDLRTPTPDTTAVLARGRRMRTRSRVATGLAAGGVLAVVATTAGFVALNSGSAGSGEDQVAGATPSPAVWAIGSDVHVGDEVTSVPDTVHSLHYTSAGVLVRSNPHDGASDGSGPETLTLVRPDGSTSDLGTIPEGWGPATDPGRDVYVLAEASGDGFEAVVRDVGTGEVTQTVPLPDLPKSYWDVPPLALDGDTLFVGYRHEMAAVDLATGETSTIPGSEGGGPLVSGGRIVTGTDTTIDVVEATSGETVLSVDVDPETFPYGTLSPDGRFLRVVLQDEAADETTVYDLSTGQAQTFDGVYGWGWTADGDLIKAADDTLTTCDAATGSCEDEPISPAIGKNAAPRMGGTIYES